MVKVVPLVVAVFSPIQPLKLKLCLSKMAYVKSSGTAKQIPDGVETRSLVSLLSRAGWSYLGSLLHFHC